MKTIIASSVLALAAASAGFAQDARPLYLEGVENGVRASDFIGKRVYVTEADTTGMSDTAMADADANWQDAGEISDMMISLSGDTEVVLVDFGGFLGIGEKTVALDMQQLALVPDADSPDDYFIVFKGTNAELESAPAFNPDMVFAAADATMPADTATDATTAPAAAPATDMAETAPMATDGMVDLTTYAEADLIGKRVYGPNDEDVGEISAVSLDADGKVAGAVVDVGGFLGMGEKEVVLTSAMLSLVPGVDGSEPKFAVSATQEQLETMDTYQR
ncbi:MAG: PRC-barrel domain containing protein [Rhodobacteraceae bacterium]|nr:PRC-barrel domain containing protein [Paracoccaceae bacterium]